MLPLHLSFCQLQAVWPTKVLCSIRGLPPGWQQNGINLIAQLCSGYSADLLSPFSIQQLNVSGVPAIPAVDMAISELNFV